jgi:hypothetical protein
MAKIEEILARRTDLSTFLVHLCRDGKNPSGEKVSAKQRLRSILKSEVIKAVTPFGPSVDLLKKKESIASQRCVCFTEAPLEQVALLLGEIDGRECSFAPYGVAITKKQGRRLGANPVWYLDITPGHDWLTEPLKALIKEAVKKGKFSDSHIAKLTPFIEQMGSGRRAIDGARYRKEFWWEREWRHVGDLALPTHVIILCPDDERAEIARVVDKESLIARFIDPRWSLEQIIARLAGFDETDVGPI